MLPPPWGAAPIPPTKVGAKCLAAEVVAHHDRVLGSWWNYGLCAWSIVAVGQWGYTADVLWHIVRARDFRTTCTTAYTHIHSSCQSRSSTYHCEYCNPRWAVTGSASYVVFVTLRQFSQTGTLKYFQTMTVNTCIHKSHLPNKFCACASSWHFTTLRKFKTYLDCKMWYQISGLVLGNPQRVRTRPSTC